MTGTPSVISEACRLQARVGEASASGRLLAAAWGCALIVLAMGCRGKTEQLVPVAGRVTLSGRPVGDATIVFECPEAAVSRAARLTADGRYEMADYRSAGLPPGTYRVAVVPGRYLDPGEEKVPLALPGKEHAGDLESTRSIPDRFRSIETSGLEAMVIDGETRSFDFALQP